MSRCLNFEFCNNKKSKIHPNEAFCIDCGNWSGFGYGWGKLTFIRDKEECSVCFETSRKKVMFPTNCGHSFCFDCTKNILIFNEEKYHLSPVSYGCKPCPNKCVNPERGKQCYCDKFAIEIQKWGEKNPLEYDNWTADQNRSIDNSENNPSLCYGSKTCPLCRAKYVKP